MNDTKRGFGVEFKVPAEVGHRACAATNAGVKITITPAEMLDRINELDQAMNVRDADLRYEALCYLRDWLSDVYEDPTRWVGR